MSLKSDRVFAIAAVVRASYAAVACGRDAQAPAKNPRSVCSGCTPPFLRTRRFLPVAFGRVAMLSKNRRKNAQIDGTGRFGEGLLLRLPPGDFCDLGFCWMSLASTASDALSAPPHLPRTVDLGVFRAKKRQAGRRGRGIIRAAFRPSLMVLESRIRQTGLRSCLYSGSCRMLPACELYSFDCMPNCAGAASCMAS